MPVTVELPEDKLEFEFDDSYSNDQILEFLKRKPWAEALGGAPAKGVVVPEQPAPAPSRALAVPPINPITPVGEMSIRGYSPRETERTANIAQAGVEAISDTLNTPLYKPFGIESLPTVTGQDIETTLGARGMAAVAPGLAGMALQAPRTTAQIIAGLQQAVVGAVEFFTTPAGALTLGASELPQLAQKGVAAYFVYQMAKQSPEMVKELAEAWYSNDTERLTRAAASLGLNTAFIAGGTKAALAKARPEAPPIIESPAEAAQVERANAALEAERQQPTTEVPSAIQEQSANSEVLREQTPPPEQQLGLREVVPPHVESEGAARPETSQIESVPITKPPVAGTEVKPAGAQAGVRGEVKAAEPVAKSPAEMNPREFDEFAKTTPLESQIHGANRFPTRDEAIAAINAVEASRESPGAFRPQRIGDQWMVVASHPAFIAEAVRQKQPVSAIAIQAYQYKLPSGYVREGDLQVYKPQPPAKPAAKEAVAPVAGAQAGGESVIRFSESKSKGVTTIEADFGLEVNNPNYHRQPSYRIFKLGDRYMVERETIVPVEEGYPKTERLRIDSKRTLAEAKQSAKIDAESIRAYITKQSPPESQRVMPGEGPPAETKLAQIVNETIEQSTSPTKLGITPTSSTRPTDVVLGATDLKSVSPKAEARWQESVREKPLLLTRLQDTAVNAWHSITREYADLPPREFPEQIDILRRLRASRNASARRTVDVLRGITHNLGPKQYGVFNRVVVLEDLLKDVESGKYADGRELPSGHVDATELTADLNKFKSIAESTPEIKAALERRGEFMTSLRETLVERGFLPETVLQDPRYFHHQVLMYLAAAKAGGPKSFRDWFSGWQKARVGSSKAYNRQYVEAEAEVVADAFNKMTMQDLQGQMKAASDLTAELKRLHGDEWASHIPATHTKWQPKRGNVFYPVKTVAERVMEEYLDGLRDILPEEFKDAVAIGPKRAEWIIPKELAKVLDNLAPRKDTWIERLAGAGIGAWKRYILLNPLRAMKYQVNNASGDVDFVFAANPRIFNEFKQAAIDSYAFHKKGKAATGDVKEAIDLGVVQSGWRASEIPDIGGSEYFNWLTGSKPGIVDRYWKWIGKWNDAREDTARLATYRFALKEWDANKPFYGASVPADVQALPTNKLKAAKVARELLIDYGRETEFGEFMRRKAVPFYRWMHGNFARYVQLVRNIPVQEGAGGTRLATVGAKKVATKSAALAARGAFAYMAINLWNNLFFSDEEEELGDTRNQLHLILGRDEQGNIQTIRFQGALSDLLGWVGLENLPQDAEDLFKGKASLGDKMEEGFEAGVSRAVNATSPFYKTAAEAMTGRSLYPNAFEPRPIRDKAEHVAGLFSLKNVYQWLAGKPHKPLHQELSSLLTYTVDPGEAAYNTTRHMVAEWLEDRGEERSQTIPGKRANALYYYKQALRYKDPKLAAKFKAEYEAMGGKQEGLTASVQRSAPLASLGKKQAEFLKSLSPAEKAVVDRAQKWYKQVYR